MLFISLTFFLFNWCNFRLPQSSVMQAKILLYNICCTELTCSMSQISIILINMPKKVYFLNWLHNFFLILKCSFKSILNWCPASPQTSVFCQFVPVFYSPLIVYWSATDSFIYYSFFFCLLMISPDRFLFQERFKSWWV